MRCRRCSDVSGMEAVRMLLRCHCAGERIVGKPSVTICTDTHTKQTPVHKYTIPIHRVHNCVYGVYIVYVHLYTIVHGSFFRRNQNLASLFVVVAGRVRIHIEMNIQAHLHAHSCICENTI